MPVEKCRLCREILPSEPVLVFKDMPAIAQKLPDSKSLRKDKSVDINVFECIGCGTIQIKGKPVKYYREVIRAADISDEMRSFRLKQFRAFVSRNSLKGRKVLEIGCGRGEYLKIMKCAGVKAFGLEYSKDSVNYCMKKEGLDVEQGFPVFPGRKLKHGPFDAIFIMNFLEHLPGINDVLKVIRYNLAENGIVLIEVPNFDMILRKKLYAEFTAEHLLYFTKRTLYLVLELNGFKIIDCKNIWHNYIISLTAKKRAAINIKELIEQKKKVNKSLKKFILGSGYQNIAVWGAGHQSLTMLSLSGISDKIKYVVDSASFKQGKNTPATHIPIVAPDKLNSDPVDAVLIMAASYSDEVATIIKEKYKNIKKVGILRSYGVETLKHS